MTASTKVRNAAIGETPKGAKEPLELRRAASDASPFDELVEQGRERAPARRLVDIAEVGRVVAFVVGGAYSDMAGDTI